MHVVGKRLPRIDAVPKVTGEAKYTVDLKMPGLLYGKILRSPVAHALIKSIDTSAAEKLPGVHCVLTGKDVPENLFAFYQWQADKTMLCTTKVRYVGDEVAAVAAVDLDTAEEAISLIEVEYEPLPAVLLSMRRWSPELNLFTRTRATSPGASSASSAIRTRLSPTATTWSRASTRHRRPPTPASR